MANPSHTPFTPIKVGGLDVQHRIALAPLTRQRADPSNQVLPAYSEEYYAQRASREGTLLVTEATSISPIATGYPSVPGIFTPDQVAQWKKVVKRIHDNKSFVFVQLWTTGRLATYDVVGKDNYVSASDVPWPEDGPRPRPLTKAEIKQFTQDYVQAAKNAIEAGADGVEIHSANGYLLDQFLCENSNNRTDEYGGSIENRARFSLEVVDAVSEAIGAERTAIRFSPWGVVQGVDPGISPIPQFSYLAQELERRKQDGKELAYIHLVEPRVHGYVDVEPIGSNRYFRDVYSGVLIRAGGLGSAELVQDEIALDDNLLIGIGRYFISNPDLVDRLEKKLPLNPYNRKSFYSKGEAGYTDYPFYDPTHAKL